MKLLPTLHILNGDASLPAFRQVNLPGQVLVWREVLSEGPAMGNVPEKKFWERRQQFIGNTYNATANDYEEKVLQELRKLDAAGAFFEVILWFDSDLMCQINLLYLLQMLHQSNAKVISVCTPNKGQHIGYLNPQELQQLFENRTQQNSQDLRQAQELWNRYCSPDPMQLQLYLQQHKLTNPYLAEALQLHLRRFPSCGTGLSYPETELLQFIVDGASTLDQVMQQFWKHVPGYGFGDAQLLRLLQNLSPELLLINSQQLAITERGKDVLAGKAVHTPKAHWLGGAQLTASQQWCYNTSSQILAVA